MTDFERRLANALRSAGDRFEPSDVAAARERFLRRRRRRQFVFGGGAIALAGAAAVIAIVLAPSKPLIERESLPDVAGEPSILATTIAVGDSPSGLGLGPHSAWVVNSADGTMSRIDLSTNLVTEVPVGGRPDDVAVTDGTIWVTDPSAGTLTPIDPASNEVGDPIRIVQPGHQLDVAVGPLGVVWIVARDLNLYRLDPGAGGAVVHAEFEGELTDVATGLGGVWVLDSSAGRLGFVEATPGSEFSKVRTIAEIASDEGDLAVGGRRVWVTAPDRSTVAGLGDVLAIEGRVSIPGAYAAVAVGAHSVWILTGEAGSGQLLRIDASTYEIIGEPIELSGDPADVALGDGSVWVTHSADATVTKFDVDDSRLFVPKVRTTPDTPE